MNNTLLLGLLVALVLGYLIFSQAGNTIKEEAMELLGKDEQEEKRIDAVMDTGEATHGAIQKEGSDHDIPIDQSMGYPSGILPGKVGTFHPTRDCDRFLCQGCYTCTPLSGACSGQPMTDDRGRNYPELIDYIRASRTNEYPFYKLN